MRVAKWPLLQANSSRISATIYRDIHAGSSFTNKVSTRLHNKSIRAAFADSWSSNLRRESSIQIETIKTKCISVALSGESKMHQAVAINYIYTIAHYERQPFRTVASA